MEAADQSFLKAPPASPMPGDIPPVAFGQSPQPSHRSSFGSTQCDLLQKLTSSSNPPSQLGVLPTQGFHTHQGLSQEKPDSAWLHTRTSILQRASRTRPYRTKKQSTVSLKKYEAFSLLNYSMYDLRYPLYFLINNDINSRVKNIKCIAFVVHFFELLNYEF